MGSVVSVDQSKNVAEALNKSTTTVVNNNNIECGQTVQQIQKNDLDFIKTGGGNISFTQYAGLISKCVLDSTDKKKLIEEIASDLVQSHKTDKGGAGLFSFASLNNQENIAKVTNELESAYATNVGAKCDLAVLQQQQNKLRNIDTGGGNINFSQTANIDSGCSIISNINTEVAKQLQSSLVQKTETTIPNTVWYVIGAVILLIIVGMVLYYSFGSNAPQRRAGMAANFPGRFPGMFPPTMAPQPLPQQQQQQPIYPPPQSPPLFAVPQPTAEMLAAAQQYLQQPNVAPQ